MSTQTVDLRGQFSGASEFINFQNIMRDNITIVNRFNTTINGSVRVVNSFNATMTGFNNSVTTNISGAVPLIDALNRSLGGLTATLTAMNNVSNSFNLTMSGTNNRLQITIPLIERMTQGGNGFLLSWQSILRLMQSQILARYIQAIAGSIDQAVISAAELDRKIAAIRTISQAANMTQNEWKNTVRALSDEFGSPVLETAVGTFDAISNQVAKGASAARFMAEAMNFARVSVSTTAESVNLLSSIINSYGISSEEAGRLASGLFAMIDLGRVSASEIANSFGPVVVSAKLLGLELEEVYTSMAILTSQGTKSSVAMTNISNVMQKLIKPSESMKEPFREWGVTSGEAAIATYGFAGVLERLGREAERGGLSRIGEIMTDLRAIRGTAGLTGGNILGSFAEVQKRISESAEAYARAKEIMAQSSGVQFEQELNKIKNVLTVDLGEAALKFFLSFSTGIGSISGLVKDFVNTLYAMLASLGTGLSLIMQVKRVLDAFGGSFSQITILITTGLTAWRAYGIMIAANTALTAALAAVTAGTAVAMTGFQASMMLLNPWLAGGALALTVILGGMALWIDAENRLEQAIVASAEKRKKAYEEIHAANMKGIEALNEADRKRVEQTSKDLNMSIAVVQKAWDAIIRETVGASSTIEEEVKSLTKIMKKMSEAVEEEVLESIKQNMASGLAGASDNISQQINIVTDAASKLREEATKALSENKFDYAMKVFGEFEKAIVDAQSRIDKALEKSANEQAQIVSKFEQRKFGLSLETMSKTKAKAAIEERIKSLVEQAKANPEGADADRLLAEAQALAEKLTETQKQANAKAESNQQPKKPLDLTQEQIVVDAMLDIRKMRDANSNAAQGKLDEDKAKLTEEGMRDVLQEQLTIREHQIAAMEKLQEMRMKAVEAEKLLKTVIPNQRSALEAAKTDVTKRSSDVGTTIERSERRWWGRGEVDANRERNRLQAELQETMTQYGSGAVSAEDTVTALSEKAKALRERAAKDDHTTILKPTDLQAIASGYSELINKIRETMELEKALKESEGQGVALQAEIDKINQVFMSAREKWPDLFKDIADETAKPIQAAADVLKTLRRDLGQMSAVFGKDGLKTDEAGNVTGFAQGGIVRGPGGFDNIHIKAMDGEGITNQQMTARYYPVLQAINRGSYPTNNVNNYAMTFNVDGTGSTGQTVRDLGKQLRRAISRKQIRLS